MPANVKKTSDLGFRIGSARKHAGLSQVALGEAFGLTRSSACQWENGFTEPTASNLRGIAAKCRVNYEWLATGRGTMRNAEQSPELQEAIQILGEASPEVMIAVLTLLKQGRGS